MASRTRRQPPENAEPNGVRKFFQILRDWLLIVWGGFFAVVFERTFTTTRETGGPLALALYAVMILIALAISMFILWKTEAAVIRRRLRRAERAN